ncbi:BatA domain-containing protein [Paenibacillus aceti]|uniref:VWFA domain-containing protein n=1 Tax=Paenibacillus aceti TaxID=1820010 RepID=A0ABQ1VPJ8_9BACL|nr:BatA domain-containing protein [Paenibacillus aceti]GGF86252.1 hypothetical protein GCM10010913_04650 [Paenibacillus aceti]
MGIGLWSGLWFGLAIPIILLMYLFKRKYIDTTVSSHLLWNHVLRNIEANRPWQKLQNRLLLWLQLLVAALLVFALMAPYIWVQGGSKHTVVIVDASASMSMILNEQTDGPQGVQNGMESDQQATAGFGLEQRSSQNSGQTGTVSAMDQLKEELSEFTASLNRKSELTLLKLGSKPQVILSRETNRGKWKQAISELTPDFGVSAYRETLSLAAAMTKEDAEARLVIFTDGRWLERSDDIPLDVPVNVVMIGDAAPGNASIEQFGVKSNPAAETVEGVSVVRNYGGHALEAELNLYGDERLLASQQAVVGAEESLTVSFADLPAAEVYRLSLSPGDSYALDNEAFAFSGQHRAPQVLLFSRGNLFLEKALQLAGASVTRMNPDDGGETGASEVPKLPERTPDIMVVDGQAPDYLQQSPWSELISRTPLWTIGGKEDKVQPPNGELKIENHPVTRYFTIKDSPTATLSKSPLPAWGKSIMEIGGLPAIYAGNEAGVARLGFLFALEDSDLPLRPEFPILVNNAVEWLQSGRAAGLGRAMVEAKVSIPVAAEAQQGVWTAIGGYAATNGVTDIPAEMKDGLVLAEQTAPAVPGLWRFQLRDVNGTELASYYLQTTASPLESAVQAAWPLQLTAGDKSEPSAAGADDGTAGSPGSVTDADTRTERGQGDFSDRYPLAYLLALLAFLVIFAEWGVYQRGRSI